MNAFIQKNKVLLKFYYTVIQLSGWILLVLSLCSPVILIVLARTSDLWIKEEILHNTSLSCLTLIFLGLLGINLAQLIRYQFDSNYKPGLVLRHGNKLIYTYVVLTLIVSTIHIVHFVCYLRNSDREGQIIFLSYSIINMIYFAAKALILIGIAQLLKRIIPIIDEHKLLIQGRHCNDKYQA